jgi:integrase/recombinase XerD
MSPETAEQAGMSNSRSIRGIHVPRTWERFLIGQTATPPRGFDRLREQLALYGGVPSEDRASTGRRRAARRPTAPAPPPASDGLDWGALRQWLDLYCSHLLGLNRAPGTLEAYRRDLERFFAACQERGLRPRGLTRLDLLSYLAKLAPRYRAGSRARKTIAIRRFFQFLADGGVLPANPFATVPSPRLERRERRVLREPEYQALRTLARRVSPRAWAIVEVLLQTGLRASELCGLRLGDVTFSGPGEPGLLLVRQGKGQKDRVVPLNSVAEEALRGYLDTRDGLGPQAPVFITGRKGTALSRQGLGSLLGRLYARLGIAGASVHTLRHTFATHALRKGVPLLTVKEVLGHSSLVSTERYLHLLRETMCAELERHAL